MKQEENHTGDEQLAIGDSCGDYYAINDCGQLQPNNPTTTPMTSSQSDPGYASAHRTNTVPTESHGVRNGNFIAILYFGFEIGLCRERKY